MASLRNPFLTAFSLTQGSLSASLQRILFVAGFFPFGIAAIDNANVTFQTTRFEGAEFQLEVRQAPLVKVLEQIRSQTQVPIHYSVLPEGLITATCVGKSLKLVLECLLNNKADLIVRYKDGRNNNAQQHSNIAEAWILGSRLDAYPTNAAICNGLNAEAQIALAEKRKQEASKEKAFEALLTKTQSQNAEERADAIGALLATQRKGDPKIKAVIDENLHHADPNVRAQALSTYAHLEGDEALPAIREALTDSSPDVRTMAVDSITNDTALLQQAVNDSDESVRDYARMKLEELTKQTSESQ